MPIEINKEDEQLRLCLVSMLLKNPVAYGFSEGTKMATISKQLDQTLIAIKQGEKQAQFPHLFSGESG